MAHPLPRLLFLQARRRLDPMSDHELAGHSDHVVGVPNAVQVMATGGGLGAQALRVRGAPIYSPQFHPDLTAADARARYLALGRDLDGPALAAVRETALRFELGRDEATVLLPRFVRFVGSRLRAAVPSPSSASRSR